MIRLVQEVVGARTTSALLEALGEEVPCAKVRTLMDLHGDAEMRRRLVLREVKVDGRPLSVALPPYLRTLAPRAELGGPREIGADNDAFAKELGMRGPSTRKKTASSVRANR